MNLIKIENTINIKGNDLQVVEYKGVRVLSSYDIARLHGKEVAQVNRQFERNKDRLKEGIDYFLIDKGEFSECLAGIQSFIPNNVKDIKLFTERGYLKLVKSFTDDLSWEVQDLLVDSYFELQQALSSKDALLLGIFKAEGDIAKAEAINRYEVGYVRPLENKVEEQAEIIIQQAPKVEYHDDVLKAEGLMNISQIAKDFGMTAQKLNKILHEKGIQFKQRGQWLLYKDYQDKGYTKSETYLTASGLSVVNTKWTQKGRQFIYELLKEETCE